MALWKDPTGKDAVAPVKETSTKDENTIFDSVIEKSHLEKVATVAPIETARRGPQASSVYATATPAKESIIASDIVIEGKIEGAGHVRIAGKFKGDVRVLGNLSIEPGAQLTAEVSADAVIIGGELNGNIQAASRVELLQSGILNGDLKAGSLTVAAGSKMRGHVEFGWNEQLALGNDGREKSTPR